MIEQRASTPNRKINSGFEEIGQPPKKISADTNIKHDLLRGEK